MRSPTVLLASLVALSVNAIHIRPRRDKTRDLQELLVDDQLIVGGGNVADGTFPWMARFSFNGINCAGALIQSDRILTSAKCIQRLYGTTGPNSQVVNIGAWNPSNGGENRVIQCVENHPNFDGSSSIPKNDIAIVKLEFASTKTPLAGNANTNYPSGTTNPSLSLAGFGATTAGSTTPVTTLKNVSLPFVSLSTCQSFYSNGLTSGMHLCVGGTSDSGACNSDEGGILMGINIPLTVNQVWTAVGIYSFSSPNCGRGAPDVFTDIAPYVTSFIRPQLSSPCAPTPAPTVPPPESFCFSESATVQVRNDDGDLWASSSLAMKDLQVGQEIFAGCGDDGRPLYETVYGFAHRDADRVAEYLNITTACRENETICDTYPLQISSDHLIFVQGRKDPVPAGSLAVGDTLMHQSTDLRKALPVQITDIQTIRRRGLYAPLTKDGTVIVDGIHASSYVSISHRFPRVIEATTKIMSEQSLFHWWMAPYRVFCTRVAPQRCMDDYNREEGFIHWLVIGKSMAEIAQQSSNLVFVAGLTMVAFFCGFFVLLEDLLERPFSSLLQGVCGCLLLWRLLCMRRQVLLRRSKMADKKAV